VAGGGSSKGIAVNNKTKALTYMRMAEVQAGLGIGAKKFQLDPEGGLAAGTIIEAAVKQYRVIAADKDLVTIEPPLDTDLLTTTTVTKVDTFTPFEGTARNWQQHALYFGDGDLLNIEAAASIEVIGASTLRSGVTWQYWGKVAGGPDEPDWQPLTLAPDEEQRRE